MATEIIDLTGSPPSSPPPRTSPPRILDFGSFSVMPTWPNFNPNLCNTNSQQTTTWTASGYAYQPSHVAATFQPNVHGGQVAIVLEPVPDSSAFLFPNGFRLMEPLTQKEHELFIMEVTNYGKGRWSKVAKHFPLNNTLQQVQSYASSFFKNPPNTYLYNFNGRSLTNHASKFMIGNNNLLGESASYYIPMIANDQPKTQETLMLFPEKGPFFLDGEASNSGTATTYGYGFQMQTDGASISMFSSGNGEIGLELRLGY